MSKANRILVIIAAALIALLFAFSPLIARAENINHNPPAYEPSGGLSTYNPGTGNYYKVLTPVAGYDSYVILQRQGYYDVVFFQTSTLTTSNGLVQFYNVYSSSPLSTTIYFTSGTNHPYVRYIFTISAMTSDIIGNVVPFNYIVALMLQGALDSASETICTKQTGTTFSYQYTYTSTANPYVLSFSPVLAGNFNLQWYTAFPTSSVSPTGKVDFYRAQLLDVFQLNSSFYDGQRTGYYNGYDLGYDDGLSTEITDLTGWDVVSQGLSSVFEVFNIKVFGYFSLGDIVSVVLVVGVVFFIFKLVRG